MADHASPSSGEQSRLLDLLRHLGREDSGPVGFGRARETSGRRPHLLLIPLLPSADAELLQAAKEAKADAALIPAAEDATIPLTNAEVPWPIAGLATTSRLIAPDDLDRWTANGFDVVAVRPREAHAACFSPRRKRLIARLDSHVSPDGLRAVAMLPVDAFILEDATLESPLSGDDLLQIIFTISLLRGPAIFLSSRVTAGDVEALLGLGIAAVAPRFPEGTTADQVTSDIATLHGAIDAIDPHLLQEGRERMGKAPVVIPFRGMQG